MTFSASVIEIWILNYWNRFPVDRWLDEGEGDKRISLELEPDKKPGQLSGKNSFKIFFKFKNTNNE